MNKILNTSFLYLILGILSGFFYREFTKFTGFPEGEFTQLGLAHAHLLVLGFIMMLIVLLLEKNFAISKQKKLFNWFFWLYNAGVILTAAGLIWHGSLTVVGTDSTAMIAGIAGLGHMLLTAGLILLFVVLRRSISMPAERVLVGSSAK